MPQWLNIHVLQQIWNCSHYRAIHSYIMTHNNCLAELRDNSGTVPLAISLLFNCFSWFLTSNMYCPLEFIQRKMCICFFHFSLYNGEPGYDCPHKETKKHVLFAYFHTNNSSSPRLSVCGNAILGAKAWLASKMMITMLHICFLLCENACFTVTAHAKLTPDPS